jgi:hypothetical protein
VAENMREFTSSSSSSSSFVITPPPRPVIQQQQQGQRQVQGQGHEQEEDSNRIVKERCTVVVITMTAVKLHKINLRLIKHHIMLTRGSGRRISIHF